MILKTVTFGPQKDHLPLPIALNTFHAKTDVAQIKPNEAVINENVIRLPNGEWSTHPYWGIVEVRGCTQIISYVFVDNAYIQRQLLVFGRYDDSGITHGFVGKIDEDDITQGIAEDYFTVTKLITGLNPYIVPSFVPYLKGVYIFLGVQELQVWDGIAIADATDDLAGLKATVGLNFRGRLYVGGLSSDPGMVKCTKIGQKVWDSDIQPGDIGETVTSLASQGSALIMTKEKEIYEFIGGTSIIEGEMRTVTRKAGCSHHSLLRKRLDELYMANQEGTFVMAPRYAKATGREVMVDPGVYEISQGVRDRFDNLQTIAFQSSAFFKDIFAVEDFDTQFDNLEIYDDGERIKLDISACTVDQENTDSNAILKIRHGEVVGQSFKPSRDCQACSFQIWMSKLHAETGEALRAAIYNDDPENPGNPEIGGDAIVEIEVDTDDWAVDIFAWRFFEFLDEEGAPFLLDENEIYWIILEDVGNTTATDKYCLHRWIISMENPQDAYTRGYMWFDGEAWENNDLKFRFSGRHYLSPGTAIHDVFTQEGVQKWSTFGVFENKPDDTSTMYWLRDPDGAGTWIEHAPDDNIDDSLIGAQRLQLKFEFTSNGHSTPYLDWFKVTGVSVGTNETNVAGFREDRYYVFGKDTQDNDIAMAHTKDGWLDLVRSNIIFGQVGEPIDFGGYRFIGVGRKVVQDYGCIFYELESDDSGYLSTPVHLKSGRLFFDKTPKKGRRIFITYKGSGVVLKIHRSDGTLTVNLEDATSTFNTREINFRTERTKWFEIEIEASSGWRLKELAFDIKLFRPQGV